LKPDGKGGMMCSLAGLQTTQLSTIVRNLNMNNPGLAKKIISAIARPEMGKQVCIFLFVLILYQITSMDLSQNGLTTLEGVAQIADRQAFPNLVRLSIANNSLSQVNELDHLRNMNLMELFLSGNHMYNGSINEPQNAQVAQYVNHLTTLTC
jgi:Leucine-rich repeat (LRR) protein